ncbi:hypothetical protein Tco_0711776 [Tanacetum coccineum]
MVCHKKVVRIPLEGDEILRVHDKRTQGVMKTLMNTKFRVDLVPGATPVAKSPYRLAPSEMQELSEQLQELQDEVMELLRKEKLYAKFTKNEKKERVKPRRVRAMAMTIQYGVRRMILAAQSEAFKQENVRAERLHRRKPLEFEVGDHVIVKVVSPYEGVMRFWKEGFHDDGQGTGSRDVSISFGAVMLTMCTLLWAAKLLAEDIL